MENFFAEKQYNNNNTYCTKFPTDSSKIDLTLKLSPCGENSEERKLKRSSSVVENGPYWAPIGQSLDRTSSLPAEGVMMFGKRVLLGRQRRKVVAAANGKCSSEVIAFVAASSSDDKLNALANPSRDSKHEGGSSNTPHMARTRSVEGVVGSTVQPPTKQEIDSMVSKKIQPRPADTTKVEIPAKRFKLGNYCSLKGDVMEILRQMPSVTTKGDGPNGKRIEGFLYKYRSGQICIVCVCHGSFLTPAEFILHAGGKEVENPMKHITVYTTNSF